MYLATAFLDEQRAFPSGAPPMSWAAMADTMATGLVTVGSHTHTHALLDRLPPAQVDEELARSTAAIEDHLGVTPTHFAYPKSVAPSDGADRAVRAAFAAPPAPGRTAAPVVPAPRSPIRPATRCAGSRPRSPRHRLRDDMRRVLNRWRYAGSDS
jgi:peptidoglycan/xylan/chitin deacetylase (PgdA/CDA1 family)